MNAITVKANERLAVGNVVENFSTIARVVGFFASPIGSDHDGHPILKAIGSTGKLRGGKWVADPAKCRLLTPEQVGDLVNVWKAAR